ncbi:helix-turn-helix domain-containing protein [Eubacterium sp. MSJ-33]|jgi:DNA-binding Xre family transcriptional regulator|uniref:helix-turn-helix domain-containing protein n=1 Tax=Eubacterium sp. MSJ-33 TaxID=2841528 RepID=UPI0015AA117A|nr:helix-turn-helix transcriptional regulator [Eubacterium sp. MSJ-33]QWT52323.1 helix-turn-helix transcriptional regulator [Eubacterium sp. MSJ-33]
MVRLRIEEILKEQGKTKYWLNKQLGMCYRNFNSLVTNQTISVRFDTLDKISKILNVPANELIEQLPDSTNDK